jgi:hypothetical protein
MPTHEGNILVVSFGRQIELPETEKGISISWEIINSLVGLTEILGKESNFMFNTLADAEEGPPRKNAFTCVSFVFWNDSKTRSIFLISAGTDQNYWAFKILCLPSVKKTNMNQ